jgi:hypothetical protein
MAKSGEREVVVPLRVGIYDAKCCGEGLGWECDGDADGPMWSAQCGTCGRRHTLTVETVKWSSRMDGWEALS